MKKVKIGLFVCRMEYGGVEAVISNYMANMDKEKFDLHIITQDINDDRCIQDFRDQGFNVHIVTHKRKSILKNVLDICKLLKAERFDIVHSHMTLTNFYVLFLAAFYHTRIRISHSHNYLKADSFLKKAAYVLLRWINCLTATDYYACGVDAAVFLFGRRNYKKGNVRILNNAIDVSKYAYSPTIRTKIRNELEINDKICVGNVGRFMEQKNQKFLIEIFAAYHKVCPSSVLLLIGDGELKEKLLNCIDKYGLQSDVIMTGNIRNVQDYYQAMDMFLLPSLFEGLPVVSVEAQNSGLPCLISDNVDKRCKITENVDFLSIDDVSEWVKRMCAVNPEKRTSQEEAITKHGYNIVKESEKLAITYLRTMERGK